MAHFPWLCGWISLAMRVDFFGLGGWKISLPIRHFGKKYGNLSALPIILVIFADYYATYRPNAVRRRKKNDRGNKRTVDRKDP